MKLEELITIKNEAIRLYALLNKKCEIEAFLKEGKCGYSNLMAAEKSLIEICEKLGEVGSERDIAPALEKEFIDINSDAKKELYFFEGYARKDDDELDDDYCIRHDEHLIYVPRDAEIDPSKMYYAIYRNIVDPFKIELVCLQDQFAYEADNNIIDDGTDIPYQTEEEYNELRHKFKLSSSGIDPIENAYTKYRTEFFEHLIKAQSEDEAISQIFIKRGKRRTISKNS